MGYADDTAIYAFIPRTILLPQAMELLNQDLAAITAWYLKLHMRINPKKTKSMVVIAGLGPLLPVMVNSLFVVLSFMR